MNPLELGQEMYTTLHNRCVIGFVNGARRMALSLMTKGNAEAIGYDVAWYEQREDPYDQAFARGMRAMLSEVAR